MAEACARLARAISLIVSLLLRIEATTVSSLAAASETSSEPDFTSLALCSISALTSEDALAADWARRRTSTATTANPLPASPARAASTEALSARRFVWKAMSSITPMMLEILADDAVICSMARVVSAITAPPCSAVCVMTPAWLLAASALLALPATVCASCSTAAEVSSMVAACLPVRSERSLAPDRISPVATLRLPDVDLSCRTMSARLSATALVSALSCAKAPWKLPLKRLLRSIFASAVSTAPVSVRPLSTVPTSVLTLWASAVSSRSAKLAVTRREKSPAMAASTTLPNSRCIVCIIAARSPCVRTSPAASASVRVRTCSAFWRNTSTAAAIRPISSRRVR